MKATARRRGGAAGRLPVVKKKKEGACGFMWGCGGSKSVSVVAGNLSSAAMTPPTVKSSTTAAAPASHDAKGAPSVDTLLRQLHELERGVHALGFRDQESVEARQRRPPPRQRHRRSASDVWGGGLRRLEEESVAVVTETADPLGEFRRSMVEMVVENGITGGAELRKLLQRFLSLNSARHHHLIHRAFADVWEELFAGSGDPPPTHAEAEACCLSYRLQHPSELTSTQLHRARSHVLIR